MKYLLTLCFIPCLLFGQDLPVILSKYEAIVYTTDQGIFLQYLDCVWKIDSMHPYGKYPD
jgi:hypothetical protein